MKLKPLQAVLLATTLAACTTPNRSVESIKTPTIQTTQLAYDIRFDGYSSLSEAQARAFDEYLTAIRIAYGDRISIDDPLAVGAAERRAAIAGVVARHGLLVEETAPVSSGRLAPGISRVVITRSRASVPNCPDWSRPSNPELAASTMSNFGCATRSNLAEMIADPNDLVSGKTYDGADGHTINKATDAFRRRQPTGYREGNGTMGAGSGAATGN